MANPNNNVTEIDKNLRIYEIYPDGHTTFTEYDDDGTTELYRQGKGVTTLIESDLDAKNRATVTIHPAKGNFNGFVKEKATEFKINVTEKPKKSRLKSGKAKSNSPKLPALTNTAKTKHILLRRCAQPQPIRHQRKRI